MAMLAGELERLLAVDHLLRALRLDAHHLQALELAAEERLGGGRLARALLTATQRGRRLVLLVRLVVGLARLGVLDSKPLEVAVRVGIRRALFRAVVVGAVRSLRLPLEEAAAGRLPALARRRASRLYVDKAGARGVIGDRALVIAKLQLYSLFHNS